MLKTPLNKAIKTTAQHLHRLKEMGIESVEDFLMYFPARYTDQSEVTDIINITLEEQITVRGEIKSIKSSAGWGSRRMSVTNAIISDKTGSVEAVWFNQPYLGKMLLRGQEIMLLGKAKYDIKRSKIIFRSPVVEQVKETQIHTARIVPVYHETGLGEETKRPGKISSKWIREKLFPLLPFTKDFPEFLPEECIKKFSLMQYPEAIKNAHFPESEVALEKAKKRLSFDELFLLQLAALHRKHIWRKTAAQAQKQIPANWDLIKEFTQSLPWALTNAQKKSVYEIIKDMERPFPMSRLLEGDTGSGKTVVAQAAVLHAVKANWQACLLAPTEILAKQHFNSFEKNLSQFGIKTHLLLGSMTNKEKNAVIEQLKNGKIQFIIGTHALIQERISFKKLGLAIIDEQHRFGVRQREILKTFGSPHMLSMTATPIPRTLALVLYGDQELSILDEMPPGRQKIITRVVPENKRAEAYKWIEKEIEKGRQAFIIFPLIEESEVLEVKAAVSEFERLSNDIFPHLKIGLLHGRMDSEEKESTMQAFSNGKIQILVSTAVVEVGVDVPNATIMMIEAAERFGLAQLHQFRGRVGRGHEQSYCFLFPTLQIPQVLQRLNSLVKYDSGFQLAEVDLQLRGPGEVYGTAQSGIPDLKMASLSDSETIKLARDAADEIIEKDPDLINHPKLLEKISEQVILTE
ncbi:MAG: ATP-dependent DNA helicase RecG [Candidatus Gracilibacteria bacterium]